MICQPLPGPSQALRDGAELEFDMYWPMQAPMPAQRPQKTPFWGATPRAPLRAPLGRWQTAFSRHWRPTVLAHPRAQHALGGPKCIPCAANRHSARISRSASPPRAPSEMIWVGSAVQRGRVQPPLQLKIPSRPCTDCLVYVCICMCM